MVGVGEMLFFGIGVIGVVVVYVLCGGDLFVIV